MPAYVYVLKCKGCGQRRSFLIHEGELPALDSKKLVERHCPTCRTMTIGFSLSRSGVPGGNEEAGRTVAERNSSCIRIAVLLRFSCSRPPSLKHLARKINSPHRS